MVESSFWQQHLCQPAGKFALPLTQFVSKPFVLHTVAVLNPQTHQHFCNMWVDFCMWIFNCSTYCTLIHLNFFFPKVRHLLERVDGDEHRTDVCLKRFYIKDHTARTNKKINITGLNHLLLEVRKLCYSIKCSSFLSRFQSKLHFHTTIKETSDLIYGCHDVRGVQECGSGVSGDRA